MRGRRHRERWVVAYESPMQQWFSERPAALGSHKHEPQADAEAAFVLIRRTRRRGVVSGHRGARCMRSRECSNESQAISSTLVLAGERGEVKRALTLGADLRGSFSRGPDGVGSRTSASVEAFQPAESRSQLS